MDADKNIKISIITPLYNTPEVFLKEMIESVVNQTYPEWELCLVDASSDDHEEVGRICKTYYEQDSRIKYQRLEKNLGISGNSNACAKLATGEYLAVLDHDDILSLCALERVVDVIRKTGSDFVYTDETKFKLSIEKSFSPNYKPDFAPDELRSHNYICHFNVFRRSLFEEVGGYRPEFDGSQDHDLVLRMTDRARNIQHISEVLYYWRVHDNSVAMNIGAKNYAVDAGIKAVQEDLARHGEYGKVESPYNLPRYQIKYDPQYCPCVAVVLCGEEVEHAIDLIEKSTKYSNIKYIYQEKDSIAIRSEHELIPVSSVTIENIMQHVQDEHVLFVDTRIAAISDNFLEEMLILSQREGVGCVGAKALNDLQQILHVGLAFDGERIRRPYLGHPDGIEGYEAQLLVTRNVSMLTGGVLLLAPHVLREESELPEFDFAVLSLRLFMKGYRNIYTPYVAVSYNDQGIQIEKDTLLKIWEQSSYAMDPYYNANIKNLNIDIEKSVSNSSSSKAGLSHKVERKIYVAKDLMHKTTRTLKGEGLKALGPKVKRYIQKRRQGMQSGSDNSYISGAPAYKDVLFISGCGAEVPHPHRYRVIHQMEQLESQGIHCDDVFYIDLSMEQVRYYTTFIFYRCPYTDVIGAFIQEAKNQNKTVLYDVDDLVIDTMYTDTIPYIQTLNDDDRRLYDSGVVRMGRTLKLCDAAITTTERLQTELQRYVSEVIVNRNVASEEMVQCSEIANEQYKTGTLTVNVKNKKVELSVDPNRVYIGYFSGSITHNADFNIVVPALRRLMQENENVFLKVVGELELPDELADLKDRIVNLPFVDYRELPKLIRSVDINIAPIEDTIFNEAKSENKWMEAALVYVPTVASNVGAFEQCIDPDKNGILCENTEEDWYQALTSLVNDQTRRIQIGQCAHQHIYESYITTKTGRNLASYIEKVRAKTTAIVLPSTAISGGIMVALKHGEFLHGQGYHVLLIASNPTKTYMESGSMRFPVIYMEREPVKAYIEKMIATMWVTVDYVLKHPTTVERYYLVQNYEVDFYEKGMPERKMALDTYGKKGFIQYVTISKWCQQWLTDDFGQDVAYAPNGIHVKDFYPIHRTFEGKIRILIEGDSSSAHKNVDESFRITNQLDPERYEVWYVSYYADPKPWYRCDKVMKKVPYQEMPHIYRQCDILIKSSILESFSYPPLEMMATGGYAVVAPNGGNVEYLKDGENCLLYEPGNVEQAVHLIETIVQDPDLRERLYQGGIQTANMRDWETIRLQILKLYGETEEDFA